MCISVYLLIKVRSTERQGVVSFARSRYAVNRTGVQGAPVRVQAELSIKARERGSK